MIHRKEAREAGRRRGLANGIRRRLPEGPPGLKAGFVTQRAAGEGLPVKKSHVSAVLELRDTQLA
jgi:hypothetical protein